MGGFAPIPMDPLPMPESKPVEAKPADISQGGDKSYSPQAGWGGKGADTMNIFTNFLSGWMGGKRIQEQRKQDDALKEVGHFQTDYNNSMMIYQTLVNNPDSKPEDKEKARQDVLRNWHELHGVQKKYLIPDSGEGSPKKKTGIKGKLSEKFGSQDPHMFAAGAIDLADKMDPTAAIAPDMKQQEAAFRFGEEKKEAKKREDYSVLLRKENRTPEEQKQLEGYENELYGPGAADKGKVATMQRTEMERNQKDTNAAREKYKKGEQLNERERTLLETAGELRKTEIPKTAYEGYAAEVGPGKRFKTYAEATDAYFKNEIKVEQARRQPSMWEEMKVAGKDVLAEQFAAEDADPSKPHKYRITINGKTEDRQLTDEQIKAAQAQNKGIQAVKIPRTPTKGDIYGWVTERMKPSPEEKEDAKHPKNPTPAQLTQLMSPVLATVLQDNPDWEKFIAKRPGPGGGVTMALNPFKPSDVKWYQSTDTARQNYEGFLKAVENEMIRRGYGGYVMQILPMGGSPEAMSPTPE